MWTEQFDSMLVLVIMAALLRTSYELTRPDAHNPGTDTVKDTEGLMPWQREASEKAVKKYEQSQGKKWRRWNEAMFERVS
jgi:hypothetical protein